MLNHTTVITEIHTSQEILPGQASVKVAVMNDFENIHATAFDRISSRPVSIACSTRQR